MPVSFQQQPPYPLPPQQQARKPRKPRPPFVPHWAWLFLIVPVAIASTASDGFPGLLLGLATIAFFASLYTVIFGRRSLMNIPSRGWGGAVLGAALIVAVTAAQFVDVDETPVAADNQEIAEPAVVETTEPAKTPTPTTKTATPKPTKTPTAKPKAEKPGTGTALALLATLKVKGPAAKTGYDRVGQFGESWIDVDGNGCDTRNDILQRDLTDLTIEGSCKVLTGVLADPYTGYRIDFTRGVDTSMAVQIDHVVPLLDAWRTGAQQLSYQKRVELANDPMNLIAADGSANSSKGAGNAATWLPSNKSFRCEYVARQISTKAAYGLWVVPAEKDAMTRILSSCPDQVAYKSGYTGKPVTQVKAKPKPKPEPVKEEPKPQPPVQESTYYKNCDAVRAAGADPIHQGEPGYGTHLDRDGDGIGCE